MATTLVIVGKSLKINKPFLDYIDSQVYLHVKTPNIKIYLDKNDNNLFENLEKIISESEQTILMTSSESFNLIGKIISTLNEDVLELKEGMLVPSKTIEQKNKSYLLMYKNKKINIIEAKENEKLPQILLTSQEESTMFSLIGLDEDSTKILLEPLADTYEIKLTSTSVIEGWSYIEATTYKYGNLEKFLLSVKSLFPDKFIQDGNILTHIVESLKDSHQTLSVAESCTGGQIASMITGISGSSEVFNGSIVSYSNDIKKAWLGVSDETFKNYGAVSELCIREMMEGILKASSSDFALATSGIAGPNGGTSSKPVGTVFVGARAKNGEILVERVLIKGDRKYIQIQSCYHALRLLLHVGKDVFFKK
ncbi:CinA family protein [Sulfurospirillum arcachonense]|uniref:CinA family protein n=1 Tax=Sulfurospirillum arcachonense TaxID=57666 RepID=UPI000469B594|nr:CinA family protein [Sulfurospirillum arcachonense]